jgi:flagellar biosynthesis protein FlhG
MTRLIAVTSARGGVGTTSIALNLAAQLAQRGQRVCLLDAARGGRAFAGEDAVPPGGAVRDRDAPETGLDALLVRDRHGFDILPGQLNAARAQVLDPVHRQRFAASLAELERYEYVLIDAIGGVDPRLLGLVLASPEAILAVTPQPRHLSEGYALLKLLTARGYRGAVSLLVNRSENPATAERACTSFRAAAQQHLERRVPLLGIVREDCAMQGGVVTPAALLSSPPESRAAQDLAALVAQLLTDLQLAPAEAELCDLADAWLQAAGGAEALPLVRFSAKPCGAQPSRRALEQQIQTLSVQIDDLMAEINRLRTEGEDIARLVTTPGGSPPRAAGAAIETRVAQLASGSERLPLGDAEFPVYQLRRSSGDLLRVALHSCDCEPEQTEPRSIPSER